MSAPIYTTAGQARAAASAAVPAGKVEACTLISVGEIDGAATHIVLVAGQRRFRFFYNGVVIVLGVEPSAPRAGTD